MASRQWYTAIGGQQAGPYTDERLGEMINAGVVRADTFVWCNGMTDWAKAGDIPGLMPRARPAPPPPPRPAPPPLQGARTPASGPAIGQPFPAQGFDPARAAQNFDHAQAAQSFGQAFSSHVPADAQALATHVRVWPLLGRVILVGLSQVVIIPTPWVLPWFYKWFIEHLELPGQQRASFTGKFPDIWYIFVLYALVAFYGGSVFDYVFLYLPLPLFFWDIAGYLLPLIRAGLSVLLLFLILKWAVQNVVWEGQSAPLTFTGTYWPLLGWYLLTIVSVITIVGWAWVQAAWTRWMCRHLEGGNRQLVFTAGGWDILWRTVLFALSCIVIIPIPWTLHWFTRWYVSQFALSNERAAA
jgi:uncharacterized membrane protein YccF (DUF307 family)